jgi:hypothetical protein
MPEALGAPCLSRIVDSMRLSPQERVLLGRVETEVIRWRVQRWFMLVLGVAVFTVGCFVSEPHAELLLVAGFATAAYVIGRWRGNATSQLILSLAERLDDDKDDA